MKKAVLIELIKENLAGGDAPAEIRGKYDPRIIEKYLDMAYNDVVFNLYEAGYQKGGDYSALDNFGKSYKVTIQEDKERKEYCSELSLSCIS